MKAGFTFVFIFLFDILTFSQNVFDRYKVDSVFQGVKATIDFKSNVSASRFKTRITETYNKQKVNFAGHYCFVEWGCGSPCQTSVIVDLKTGKVYDALNAAIGYNYKIDSRVIIVNPMDSTVSIKDSSLFNQETWLFIEETKRFIKIQ